MAAKRGKNLTVEERIQFVVSLMEAGQFRRGRTGKMLAKEWGLSVSAVGNITCEASRIVKRAILDPETVSVDVSLALRHELEAAQDDASSLRGTREGLKARDQVIAAAKVWSDITGATAPQKLDIEHKETQATPEDAARIMRAKFGKVTPGSE